MGSLKEAIEEAMENLKAYCNDTDCNKCKFLELCSKHFIDRPRDWNRRGTSKK